MTDEASPILPAYARSLGIAISDTSGDTPILAIEFSNSIEGRPQHLHGGATAGLLENAGYAALRVRLLAEGHSAVFKPINITVQYLSAGKSKQTFAQGHVARLGRRNANITVEAWQDDRSRPIASAVMNILMA